MICLLPSTRDVCEYVSARIWRLIDAFSSSIGVLAYTPYANKLRSLYSEIPITYNNLKKTVNLVVHEVASNVHFRHEHANRKFLVTKLPHSNSLVTL
jgi:hypothetical protein